MIGYTYTRQFGLTRKGKPRATWGRKVLHPADFLRKQEAGLADCRKLLDKVIDPGSVPGFFL